MRAIETITGRVSVLNRDDVDTDQIIPKQFLKRVERTGFGEFLFFDWAKEPGWELPEQSDPGRRAQLRLRLEPRARPVGARGLRLSGDHRAELRRHLPLQLHEDRAAAGASERRGVRLDRGGRRGAGRPRGAGGALAGRDGELRDRSRHQAPAAERPRRHRADARAGRTRSRPTSATASAPARSRRRYDSQPGAAGTASDRRDLGRRDLRPRLRPPAGLGARAARAARAARRRGRARRRLRLGARHRAAGRSVPRGRVYAVDVAPSMVEHAREALGDRATVSARTWSSSSCPSRSTRSSRTPSSTGSTTTTRCSRRCTGR